MTAEEIDIIVQASVEQAIKEFKKLLPEIKKQLKGMQEEFDSLDIKNIAEKANIKEVSKQIKEVKKQIKQAFDPNDISSLKIHFHDIGEETKNAKSYLEEYHKEMQKQPDNFKNYKFSNLPQNNVQNLSQNVEVEPSQKSFKLWETLKAKIRQAKTEINGMKSSLKQMPKITQGMVSNVKSINSGFKQGLKNVLKYAGALVGLRSAYYMIRSASNAWLSSENAQAKQTKANIEYLTYAFGSIFAPVLQFITNLAYQLLKAIQSLAYAFSGVNVFAKATASSMKSASNSAKQTSKSLSSVHSDINNVSKKDNSGSGSVNPSMDLSQMDGQMSSFAEKLYSFFKPLKESWDKYGKEIIQSISNVVGIVGQAISDLVSSTGFQTFIDGIMSALSGILQFLEPVIEGFSEMSGIILEIVMSAIGDLLKKIGDTLQAIGKNETAVEILKAVGAAIAIIVGAIIAWNIAQAILNGLMGIFAIITSPITLIILAIVAAITAIILIIKNWGAISEWFGDLWKTVSDKIKEIWENVKQFFINTWNNIVSKIKEVWNGVRDFFSNLWNGIKNIATNVFNAIASFFSNIWNGIKNVVINVWNGITSTISNVINGIKNTISNVLNAIKTVWDNIWNGLKNTVSNVFNGIWNSIKGVINSILGGIEGMANGVIKGINALVNALNKISFDIPDWVPLLGGKKFGFDLRTLNTITLPRLAKGNVAYSETMAIFGEYAGAKNNPEITAPQSILRETFDDVLSSHEWGNGNNDRPINLAFYVGNKKLGEILLEDLRNMKRQTGKDVEALVGG